MVRAVEDHTCHGNARFAGHKIEVSSDPFALHEPVHRAGHVEHVGVLCCVVFAADGDGCVLVWGGAKRSVLPLQKHEQLVLGVAGFHAPFGFHRYGEFGLEDGGVLARAVDQVGEVGERDPRFAP